jgi:hypothetical protein
VHSEPLDELSNLPNFLSVSLVSPLRASLSDSADYRVRNGHAGNYRCCSVHNHKIQREAFLIKEKRGEKDDVRKNKSRG